MCETSTSRAAVGYRHRALVRRAASRPARRVREYGIREHELVANLNEHGRVSDPEHGELGVGPHGVFELRAPLADVLETELHRVRTEARQNVAARHPGGGESDRESRRCATSKEPHVEGADPTRLVERGHDALLETKEPEQQVRAGTGNRRFALAETENAVPRERLR